MFLGHFAVGFGAKRLAPQTSLGTLFLAAQFIDLLWPTLLLLGLERVRIVPGAIGTVPLVFEHYPYSHSLLSVIALGAVFALLYYGIRRFLFGAVILGLVLVTHWGLDLLVHQPDLPLAPGVAARLGFGLWASPSATLALELTLFVTGLGLYLRTTRAIDGAGGWALWSLVLFLLLIHFANTFGEPPPSVAALAWVGQAQWLLVAWGYWVDRHRSVP